ncbi:hypothetical protein C1637_16680 [Chryseobacterium lactis]|uniref:GAF domain-containing protein n=1 Tax=Chryseobacterium lactis TaxID=1241981 RepID=A0A3G6RMV5_CHRLC|nr:hypothetical protein [Chryseobacterium lactis]AZA84123.1 hypothetical protein EG342_20520 [Chryseobacterium lactis]AZB04509.1 hypothetical protein EG341_11395 [Chryseobacterium lactis]PNW12678.1 hypothetical protein C1637_16680 [Chryseobacterium lactis]
MILNKSTYNSLQGNTVEFSFAPFLNYLKDCANRDSILKKVIKSSIDKINKQFPELQYAITYEDIPQYEDLYFLVYQLMNSTLVDENEFSWGVSAPFSHDFIFGTPAIAKQLKSLQATKKANIIHWEEQKILDEKEVFETLAYNFIVKHVYDINPFDEMELVICINENGSERYLQFNINNDFIEIDGVFPDIKKIKSEMVSKQSVLEFLKKNLPLEKVNFKGFSIIRIEDVTYKVTKDKLRKLFISQDIKSDFLLQTTETMKSLIGSSDMDLLFLPILEIDGKLNTEIWKDFSPVLSGILIKYKASFSDFTTFLENYIKNPEIRYQKSEEETWYSFENTSISGLFVLPIFYQEKIVGVSIILYENAGLQTDLVISSFKEFTFPLQNLFISSINRYLGELSKTIKNHFTAIQPAVEWKFNDAGIAYLKNKKDNEQLQPIPIQFDDIYPIYGAIDFRNSTIERNKALTEDYTVQLNALIQTLQTLKQIRNVDLLGELIYQAEVFIKRIQSNRLSINDDAEVTYFLTVESLELILQMCINDDEVQSITSPYLKELPEDGVFHKESAALEETFLILNTHIISVLDKMNEELQNSYPYYFDRYRTDGVEFNIYIGQSIDPEKPFNEVYLRNVRLRQLISMVNTAIITESCQNLLPKKIQTTQLIFVQPNTITISFRNDEKRFDVEGAYNIRYEIIKKRIDKALIKNTNERLTQPRKIAIVYYNKKDIEDYLKHIEYLQKNNILEPAIEDLDLEDMQGVSGLKAIRITIQNASVNSIKTKK